MASSRWKIVDTGTRSAEENMRLDAQMLEKLSEQDQPLLHLYEWTGESSTFGHFVNPSDYLDVNAAAHRGLQLAKRPTGGGIVFHIWDMAFSALVPSHCPEFSSNTLENYAFVNRAVLHAVLQFLGQTLPLDLIREDAQTLDDACGRFCMARPTKYDLMLEGRKIAGAAQRKCKAGFLHQGTIALVMPDVNILREVLLPKSRVLEAMQSHTFALLGEKATERQMAEAKRSLRQLLASSLNALSLEYTAIE